MSDVDPTKSLRSSGGSNGSALEAAQAARARLLEVEMGLRRLWIDNADQDPALAARLNTAARFAHHAAEALADEIRL